MLENFCGFGTIYHGASLAQNFYQKNIKGNEIDVSTLQDEVGFHGVLDLIRLNRAWKGAEWLICDSACRDGGAQGGAPFCTTTTRTFEQSFVLSSLYYVFPAGKKNLGLSRYLAPAFNNRNCLTTDFQFNNF